jgi:hypothetical protein
MEYKLQLRRLNNLFKKYNKDEKDGEVGKIRRVGFLRGERNKKETSSLDMTKHEIQHAST